MTALRTVFPVQAEAPPRHFRLRVEHYHGLIARGVIPEGAPYELIDGLVVRKDRSAEGEDPMTVGRGHTWAVTAWQELNGRLRRRGCYVRIHQPLTLPPYDEPEPDVAIVAGSKDDYRDGHPGASDVLCVVEVADSSLAYDRTTKQRIYARFRIRQYVIVNLVEGVVEVYTEPVPAKRLYRNSETLSGRGSLALPMPGGSPLKVPVRLLLP